MPITGMASNNMVIDTNNMVVILHGHVLTVFLTEL